MLYDLIIIGGGPAGITAGIYAARKKIKTLLITKEWGGQITKAIDIENWPGTKKISGMDLMKNMTEHLKEFEIEIKENKEIIDLDKKGDNFILNDGEQTYEGKSVIIATGKIPRTLNISGEEEFRGRGVSVCSTCDAPIFKDKNVAVIGGGNSGFNVALDVIKYAKKVYILEFFEEMKGDAISKDKLAQSGIVEFVTNVSVKEIKGTKFVESLIYEDRKTGEDTEIKIDGVFISVGMEAKAGFTAKLVELNKIGEIVIDKDNNTKTPGLFAAGDITDIKYEQIVIACGEGSKAVLAVMDYLKERS
ncbi:MAG TPA: FAD-dependent oxidoreductase [Candidatus Portnoybacteria bacterium]|jgi:NADH-dependent peroxiredoxin subunit F|nr:FAD-dependent oxidoreductase [Candidatus Portnoybacteria bacterium]MDD5752028.1 FAD-dependent oxidoreductase [Candidatus Portnoybacteria bacterium]HNU96731.1 FAD-dependent oxidoreductase [Candidatus Portnoybacteria bacterium]HOZ16378.1 FAD-dependent oxidoreductase [Candidatus Portnoybacteria bacterium]HPH52072.1 FAD-dependent oxidoreductase [Candidatus Portnoybacteria bacterium]